MFSARFSPGLAAVCAAALAIFARCDGTPPEPGTQLEGDAMGTTWRVITAHEVADSGRLRAVIAACLEEIEGAMSHWREDSEISRFNAAPAGAVVAISAETAE
ncbi:MAG: FAD:protein FMN transferase, partial [Verrucomicrobiales bacterium]